MSLWYKGEIILMNNDNVSVLGTVYDIVHHDATDVKLSGCSGYIEPWSKKIVLSSISPDNYTVDKYDSFMAKVLRHEIVHAFLIESGMFQASWGGNEDIVDWIALQIPKMVDAMKSVGCLDAGTF